MTVIQTRYSRPYSLTVSLAPSIILPMPACFNIYIHTDYRFYRPLNAIQLTGDEKYRWSAKRRNANGTTVKVQKPFIGLKKLKRIMVECFFIFIIKVIMKVIGCVNSGSHSFRHRITNTRNLWSWQSRPSKIPTEAQ